MGSTVIPNSLDEAMRSCGIAAQTLMLTAKKYGIRYLSDGWI